MTGRYEGELKQVIGDTKAAYDISEHDTRVWPSLSRTQPDTTSPYYALICIHHHRHLHAELLRAAVDFER